MTTKIAQTLLQPTKLGDLTLKNKLVMAPMSRFRADPKTLVPTDLMAEYYSQRAQFGLIITESSPISALSNSTPGAGGIFTQEQAAAWKKVTQAVHQKQGKIFIQLFHCGRAVAKDYINGQDPLAPSPIPISQIHRFTNKPHPVPKEMDQQDIDTVIAQFKKSAELAKEAEFDGIQIHAGNGFLIDQFLRDGSNKRTDKYGGSIENRCRFMLEVLDAVVPVFGPGRTGVRFSPTGRFGDMYDSNPLELMKTALKLLEPYNLAFVEVKKHDPSDFSPASEGAKHDSQGRLLPDQQLPKNYFGTLKSFYKGNFIANCGFQPETAAESIEKKENDLVAFGTLALQNPDLPQRIENNWPINRDFDFSTFYMGGEKGYTDLPFYQQ